MSYYDSDADAIENYRLLLAIMDADDYKAAVLKWKAQRDEIDTAVRGWSASMKRNLELHAEIARLREALVKVRAHTSYPDIPNLVLLYGLLQSIERIADAALGEHLQSPDPDSGSK